MSTYSRVSEAVYSLKHNAARAAKRVHGAVVFYDEAAGGWRWGQTAEQEEDNARFADLVLGGEGAVEDGIAERAARAEGEQYDAHVHCLDCQAAEPAACVCPPEPGSVVLPAGLVDGDREDEAREIAAANRAHWDREPDPLPPCDACGAPPASCDDCTGEGLEDAAAEQRAADAAAFEAADPDLAEQHERDTFVPPPEITNDELVGAARDQAALMKGDHPKVAWLLDEMARRLAGGVWMQRGLRPVRSAPARQPRQSRQDRDWTVKPVITSATNQGVQRLIDRIDAARGDLAALRDFRFSRSSTYYQMAGRFLDALIAQAEAAVGREAA